VNGFASVDSVIPPYNKEAVFECKFELDSLAAFLEISSDYYSTTGDSAFFARYQWVAAVQAVLNVADAMTTPTYDADGSVFQLPYSFTRLTTSGTETLDDKGSGNPVRSGTGLIRSAIRPSDDNTIYELFIPANMMFSHYLRLCGDIMRQIKDQQSLSQQMYRLAWLLRAAILDHGIVQDGTYNSIYAYEVDGYGSQNTMDDANVPSLLSAPFLGYNISDSVYQNTRKMILSADNPYFIRGHVINAVGGPHDGPGYAWPMASIVRILTSTSEAEIYGTLKEIVSSTAGLGLIHESVNTFNQSDWTREWYVPYTKMNFSH